MYSSRLTSWPVSDLITTHFGMKVFAFILRLERLPLGAVDIVGVDRGDEETLVGGMCQMILYITKMATL